MIINKDDISQIHSSLKFKKEINPKKEKFYSKHSLSRFKAQKRLNSTLKSKSSHRMKIKENDIDKSINFSTNNNSTQLCIRNQSKENSNNSNSVQSLNNLSNESSFDNEDRIIDDNHESRKIPACPEFNSKLHQFNNSSRTAYNNTAKIQSKIKKTKLHECEQCICTFRRNRELESEYDICTQQDVTQNFTEDSEASFAERPNIQIKSITNKKYFP